MNSFYIDDITWNDLSMEQVYERINTAESSVGQEVLKSVLRNQLFDEDILRKRSERADHFAEKPDLKNRFKKIFKNLGRTKKLSLYDYIFKFDEINQQSNGIHYILIILLLIAIALVFISPVIGIIALIVMFAINISSYFKYKAEVESYFMCFKYIVRMMKAASDIVKTVPGTDSILEEQIITLKGLIMELAPLKRGSWLLTNSVSGSLVDVIMDYVRMLFHVDLIKFNNMRKLASEKTSAIDLLFKTLGELETDICISDYRSTLDGWCRPEFSEQKTGSFKLEITGMYHPLTETIVKNDISTSRSVLLTGSNASGKSTFLKQMAINQIFAQTLYTCLADRFLSGTFRVMSSMALADNILGSESYFVVEIKSLKRIFDMIEDPETNTPVMCFIDEVLRGTNTRERIAASSQILKKMSGMNALCFAATHDIELTELLKDDMENFHFEESVNGNDVTFDYKIRKGPAMTRNALKLMMAMGFDPEIISAAEKQADSL